MSAADNKKIIQDMFAEMSKGNVGVVLETMAEDARWSIIGTTRFSGTYEGKQQIVEKLLGPLAAEIEGGFAVTPENVLADGEHVVMQARGRAITKTGKPYENTYCMVYRLVNGKIQETTEYLDTEVVSSVFGK